MRLLLLLVLATGLFAQQRNGYRYYVTGSEQDVQTKTTPGFLLAGGGKDDDESFRWFLQKAGGGDVVVLRASGADGYHKYMTGLSKIDSVESIVFESKGASSDEFVLDRIRKAEAIFLSGGDQWNYVRYWKDTPVMHEINKAIERGVPVGGTSAGLAVLGEYGFSAEHDTVTSAEALKNAHDPKVTITHGFLKVPNLECLITDSHFGRRERMGRLLVFLSRIGEEGACKEVKGLGIDERATVLLEKDGSARVAGAGSAYMVKAPGQVVRVGSGGTLNVKSWTADSVDKYQLSIKHGAIDTSADPWAALRVFEGKWEGTVTGEPGKGTAKREYRWDVRGRFLTLRNRSVYEKENHEDMGVFSYDRSAKKVVLRQFHVEGFVNEYVQEKNLEFVTSRIENIPAGWRAKETYRIVSNDEIVETFSLAPPGKDFSVYSETRLRRTF